MPPNADLIAECAVNGQMLETLCLCSRSWQHVFYVLRESTQAALLGLDFLVPNHDFVHGRLYLWDISIPLLVDKDLVPECCNVSVASVMTWPLHRKMLVPAQVSPPGPINQLPDFVGYLVPNLWIKSECVVAVKPYREEERENR